MFQAYPDYWIFQGYFGAHLIAVDLSRATSPFNISVTNSTFNWNLTALATEDTCALCGICAPTMKCEPLQQEVCNASTQGTLSNPATYWNIHVT